MDRRCRHRRGHPPGARPCSRRCSRTIWSRTTDPNSIDPDVDERFDIPLSAPASTRGAAWMRSGGTCSCGASTERASRCPVVLSAPAISLVIGIWLGLLAGFRGGKTDTFISRLIDIILSLPLLLIAIGLAVACGVEHQRVLRRDAKPGWGMVMFIIALFGWTYIARIVRGQTLSLREREFVEAPGRPVSAAGTSCSGRSCPTYARPDHRRGDPVDSRRTSSSRRPCPIWRSVSRPAPLRGEDDRQRRPGSAVPLSWWTLCSRPGDARDDHLVLQPRGRCAARCLGPEVPRR